MSLDPLSFITQKVIHTKTGHVFLLYSTVDKESDGCTMMATLGAGPGVEGDSLSRWWSGTWSKKDMQSFTDPRQLVANIEEGLLHIKGWSGSKLERESVPLKLVVDPTGSDQVSLSLDECPLHAASLMAKQLLLQITERAQTQNCQIFADDEQLAEARTEIAQLTRQLKKTERQLLSLRTELETTKESLKEFVVEKERIRRPAHQIRIPANHSKASVTKKRRLVQKPEFED